MSLTPSIGTKISYSDSLPQTYDQSGFENLSFTELGNVESIPQLGTQRNTNSYTPVGTGTINYYKTTTDHPEMTVPVSFSDDAALEAMRTARDSDSEISFLVEYNDAPNGGTASARYFAAFVTGVMDEVGGADGIIMAQVMLRPQPSTYVEVAAAAGA